MQNSKGFEASPLRSLIWAARVEGLTLLLLVGVAVPLKYLAGDPQLVSFLGPVHGIAFITYVSTALMAAAEHSWSRGMLLRVLLAAFVPAGGFFTARLLRKQG